MGKEEKRERKKKMELFLGGGGGETPLVGRRMCLEWDGYWPGWPLPGAWGRAGRGLGGALGLAGPWGWEGPCPGGPVGGGWEWPRQRLLGSWSGAPALLKN